MRHRAVAPIVYRAAAVHRRHCFSPVPLLEKLLEPRRCRCWSCAAARRRPHSRATLSAAAAGHPRLCLNRRRDCSLGRTSVLLEPSSAASASLALPELRRAAHIYLESISYETMD
ncbi:hypothetical protein Scep_012649 [Stephania cephalantha]|uniref:Uncharacterized protein n=1 Tax=Stephania cephalantha TaxID=152367 RepID=A0AAP0PA19_9MAGN